MLKNKNKYTCVFCSNTKEKSKNKVFFCNECLVIRQYIRDYGIKEVLNKIQTKPSCPPY